MYQTRNPTIPILVKEINIKRFLVKGHLHKFNPYKIFILRNINTYMLKKQGAVITNTLYIFDSSSKNGKTCSTKT